MGLDHSIAGRIRKRYADFLVIVEYWMRSVIVAVIPKRDAFGVAGVPFRVFADIRRITAIHTFNAVFVGLFYAMRGHKMYLFLSD